MFRRVGAETVANFQKMPIRPAMEILLQHEPDNRYSQTAWQKITTWYSGFSKAFDRRHPVHNCVQLTEKGYDSPWWTCFKVDYLGLTRVRESAYSEYPLFSGKVYEIITDTIEYLIISIMLLICTSILYSQDNTIQGKLESIPYNINKPSKVILKNKTDGKIYSDSLNSGENFLIKHVPNGNYTLEVLSKDNHWLKDTMWVVNGNLNRDVQVVEFQSVNSQNYINLLDFVKRGLYTTSDTLNNKTYYMSEENGDYRVVLNESTWPDYPSIHYLQLIKNAHKMIEDSTQGLIKFRYEALDSLNFGTTWISTPNPPSGSFGYTLIHGPPVGNYIYRGASVQLMNVLGDSNLVKAVISREIGRSIGFGAYSIDSDDAMYFQGNPNALTFSHKEYEAMKLIKKLKIKTKLSTLRQDSVITFIPTNYHPSVFGLVTPNNISINPVAANEFKWNRSIDNDNDNLEYFLRIFGQSGTQEFMTLDTSITLPANTLNINQNYTWQVIVTDGTADSVNSVIGNFNTFNNAPTIVTPIGSVHLQKNNPAKQFVAKLTPRFSDVENDLLTYFTASNNSNIVPVLSQDTLYALITQGWSGSGKIGVKAFDGLLYSPTDSATINVNNNAPIRIAQISDKTFPERTSNAVLADLRNTFSDPDHDSLTYSITPQGLGLFVRHDSLLADLSEAGIYKIIVRATDNESASASDTFSLKVTDVTPPHITLGALATPVVKMVRFAVAADEPLVAPNMTVNAVNLTLTKQGQIYFGDYVPSVSNLMVGASGEDTSGNVSSVVWKYYSVAFLNKPARLERIEFTPQSDGLALIETKDTASAEYTRLSGDFFITQSAETQAKFVLDDRLRALSDDPLYDARKIGFYSYANGTWIPVQSRAGASSVTALLKTDGRYAVFYDRSAALPVIFELKQNYPNPFNPATKIEYSLKEAGYVDLRVYNLLGQEVRKLVSSHRSAGWNQAEWDGKNNAGMEVASGIYLYRLKCGEFSKTKKMLLVK